MDSEGCWRFHQPPWGGEVVRTDQPLLVPQYPLVIGGIIKGVDTSIIPLTLSMLRLLSSKAQELKIF